MFVGSDFVAMQGNCQDADIAIGADLKPPLMTERQGTQCVLLVPFDTLFFYGYSGEGVWLDNLLLRLDRSGGFSTSMVRRNHTPSQSWINA